MNESEKIARVTTVLDDIDSGVHATTGRQFGQGMAHASKLVRAALDSSPPAIETRTWIPHAPRNSTKGERNSKHLIDWIISRGGEAEYVPVGRLAQHPLISVRNKSGFAGFDYLAPGERITFDGRDFTIERQDA